jgi:signal transduction histidine kinase
MAIAVRHSQATAVAIRLEIGEEEVTLQIEDNGVGFEPPSRMVDLLRTGHYGLAGIAERVESLRGSLMIDANPGNGTRIAVEIPRQEVTEQS